MIVIDNDFFEKYGTKGMGFTYGQLRSIGVSVPPKRGWKREVIGKKITTEQFESFVSMKGKRGKTIDKSRNNTKNQLLVSIHKAAKKIDLLNSHIELAKIEINALIGKIGATGNICFSNCSFSVEHILNINGLNKFDYYSPDFRELRYKVFLRDGEICAKCGATPRPNFWLEIDHIKPVSKYPELALDIDNLQVLCKDCNRAKSNIDEMNYRRKK